MQVGLAKGKKQYDKRQTEKEKDWQREKERILRSAPTSKHSIIRLYFGADPVSTWVTKQNRAYRGLVSS